MTISLSSPNSSTASIQKNGGDVITFDANNNATFAGTVVSGSAMGMRNRIINGDMRIDQRNAGAAVTVNDSDNRRFAVDRTYGLGVYTAGVFTVQQSTTVPAGFVNSIIATVTTTAASPASTDNYVIGQIVEGFNIADLGWGTASAQTVTLSFWVRSSLTGTFGGSLRNSDNTRSYPYSYVISAANTWEYKTVTITGDTSGTWLTTNGRGIRVDWSLGSGSSRLGTAGAWNGNFNTGATGQVNLMATNGATFYITGVQLEVGSTATPFERRLYGQELALCQRYYYRIKATAFGVGQCFSSTGALGVIPFPVTMRTSPTALEQSGTASDYRVFGANTAGINCNAVPVYNATTGFQFGYYELSVASGLVAGNITNVTSGTANAYLGWSAEL